MLPLPLWQIDAVDDETFGLAVQSSLGTSSKTESFISHIPPHELSANAQLAHISEQDVFTMDWNLETSESKAGDPINIVQEFSLTTSESAGNEEVGWLASISDDDVGAEREHIKYCLRGY